MILECLDFSLTPLRSQSDPTWYWCSVKFLMMVLNGYPFEKGKINSRVIINLRVKPKMIQLLEGNIWENLCDLEIGQDFTSCTRCTKRRDQMTSETKLQYIFNNTCKDQKGELWEVRKTTWTKPSSKRSRKLTSTKVSIGKASGSKRKQSGCIWKKENQINTQWK